MRHVIPTAVRLCGDSLNRPGESFSLFYLVEIEGQSNIRENLTTSLSFHYGQVYLYQKTRRRNIVLAGPAVEYFAISGSLLNSQVGALARQGEGSRPRGKHRLQT